MAPLVFKMISEAIESNAAADLRRTNSVVCSFMRSAKCNSGRTVKMWQYLPKRT